MSSWRELNLEEDHETLAILHLGAQMLGKVGSRMRRGRTTAGT
jgi:hypothetical protein